MDKLPKSITTVTLFSKILAVLILVFIIPMASFYAGMQYQKAATIGQLELPTVVTHAQQIQTVAEKSVRDYLEKYKSPTALSSQRISQYRLFHPQNLREENNTLTFEITFAVEPFSKTAASFWLSSNGKLEESGWVDGKRMLAVATKAKGTYQLTSIKPVTK